MGGMNLGSLRVYDSEESYRADQPSQNAGRATLREQVPLMRIGEHVGDVRFIENIVDRADVSVRRREVTVGGKTFAWFQIEVVVAKERGGLLTGVTAQDELVIAEYPWSQEWARAVRFKPAATKGKSEVALDPAITDLPGVLAALDAEPSTPFCTDSDKLLAAVADPRWSVADVAEGDRDPKSAFRYLFAVCRNREALCARVLADGRLAAAVGSVAARGAVVESRFTRPVDRELKGDRHSLESLANDAVRLAFAGPDDEASEERLLGRPVVELAKDIFKSLVDVEGKFLRRRRAAEAAVATEVIAEAEKVMKRSRSGTSYRERVDVDELMELMVTREDFRRLIAKWFIKRATNPDAAPPTARRSPRTRSGNKGE